MNSTSLQDFVGRVCRTGRISFGDLRRLQRDILPGRLATREDAELLLSADRAVHRADADWSAYLISTVRDFVLWGMPPVGAVDHAKAEWLIDLLSASKGSKASRAIAREVAEQACEVDDTLIAALGRGRRIRVDLSRDGEVASDACEARDLGGLEAACELNSTAVNQIAA